MEWETSYEDSTDVVVIDALDRRADPRVRFEAIHGGIHRSQELAAQPPAVSLVPGGCVGQFGFRFLTDPHQQGQDFASPFRIRA